ncbi:MAG: DnaB-like helicase C-terminal domain-containing protein, partial [Planctomycetota bacterium]
MSANDHFIPAADIESLQAVVLQAALHGDETCRGELTTLHTGFEEPYRTIAAVLLSQLSGGSFADHHTVGAAIQGQRLRRTSPNGGVMELTAQAAMNLVCASPANTAQAIAYLPVLRNQLEANRLADFKARAEGVIQQFGNDPAELRRQIELLTAQTQRTDAAPTEAILFFPYFGGLVQTQTGADFLGLDSGFPLLNQITNGLDTGLWVLAAAPSTGKTTLAFQMCQQVAANRVPVLFVSLEQSVGELRTKALARLSRINSHHIGRGRLRSDNPDDMAQLMQAATEYFSLSRYLT